MRSILRVLPLVLLFAIVSVGCDTATDNGGDEFPLTSEDNASFTFEIGQVSGTGTVTSEPQSESSASIINDSRFDPGDIASAQIRTGSVELSLDFPGGADQAIDLSSATLTLSATGVSPQVVARGSDFSLVINTTNAQSRRAVLEVTSADITRFLRQDTFNATLDLDVTGAGDGEYQFTVTFDVDATVLVNAMPPATDL